MIFAAIVAGGTGSRMGADMPKQFLDLCGKPVLVHTVKRFLDCRMTDMIYVGVHADWCEAFTQMCTAAQLDMSKIKILAGGAVRDDTVRIIIDAITKEYEISDSDIILTHDGVRPFVSDEEIRSSIRAMEKTDGATICLPSTDTLLYSEDGAGIDSVPDRSKLFRALTPQTFRLTKLIEAYNSLTPEQCKAVTDTASVFMLAGAKVSLIRGAEENIKLTTPADMRIAELICKKSIKEPYR